MRVEEKNAQQVHDLVERMGPTHPHLKDLLKVWDFRDNEGRLKYQVLYDQPYTGVNHLRIVGASRDTLAHNYMDMQEIKNKIWGLEVVAVEIFPAQSQFKDGSNTYHLWTWPGLAETAPNLKNLYTYAK